MLLLLLLVVLMWYVDVLWEGTWRSLSCRCTQWKVTKRSSMLLMVLVDWVLVKVLQSLSQQDEMVGSSTLYILMILVSLAALHSHHLCQPCCSTFSWSLSALLLYILVILAALHSHDPCHTLLLYILMILVSLAALQWSVHCACTLWPKTAMPLFLIAYIFKTPKLLCMIFILIIIKNQ